MTMTTTVPPTIEATTPRWRGINHLALITTDMDATVRFYHGTLGAQLVASLGTPEFRHYFFEFGPQCTVAFFEYTNASTEPFTKAAGTPDPRAAQFDHLALNLPDEDALICGDDPRAKELALELASRLVGGRAVDVGPLANSRALEAMTAVILNVNREFGVTAGLRLTGLP